MKSAVILAVGLLVVASLPVAAEEREFTQDFELDECQFSDRGGNRYFSLEPGTRHELASDGGEESVQLEITVLGRTRPIAFETPEGERVSLRARIVEEREWVDGELAEVSWNYYARCKQTNDVYYFGEDVDFYEDGVIVGHDGSWRAGLDGAQPGLIMPGTVLLGSRYFQEIAPDVALDRAEHVRHGFEIDVPAGSFDECVEVVETTPLEPGAESRKTYCDGVGLVADGDVELVEPPARPCGTERGPRAR